MDQIKEYILKPDGDKEITVKMPANSNILSLVTRHQDIVLCCAGNTKSPEVIRTFRVFASDVEIIREENTLLMPCGTVVYPHGKDSKTGAVIFQLFHVFEVEYYDPNKKQS